MKPEPGQVWWAFGVGTRLKGWRVVMLEGLHKNMVGLSWSARDLETWQRVWLSAERFDPISKKNKLVGPESSQGEFYTFRSDVHPHAVLR